MAKKQFGSSINHASLQRQFLTMPAAILMKAVHADSEFLLIKPKNRGLTDICVVKHAPGEAGSYGARPDGRSVGLAHAATDTSAATAAGKEPDLEEKGTKVSTVLGL